MKKKKIALLLVSALLVSNSTVVTASTENYAASSISGAAAENSSEKTGESAASEISVTEVSGDSDSATQDSSENLASSDSSEESLSEDIADTEAVLGTPEEDNKQTLEVSSSEELAAAVATINKDTSGNASYVISLKEDIETQGFGLTRNTTTIIGNGHTLTFTNYETAIYVNGSASDAPTLILGDSAGKENTLNLKGSLTAGDGYHFLRIGGIGYESGNGTVRIYDGVTIKDSYSNNTFGGGIYVSDGGVLEMNGGLITNCGIQGGSVCYGGGVAVMSGGKFTMNGGSVQNCFAKTENFDACGGGVYVDYGSTFELNGGAVEENEASSAGGGVMLMTSLDSIYEHQAYGYLDSKFVMTGGSVRNNKAGEYGGGLAVMETYADADPLCTFPEKTGSPSDPGIYISGGTFEENTAEDYGGAIFIYRIRGAIPVQITNVLIKGNEASTGAGIDIYSYWTQAKIDGCTITENRASQNGGGVAMMKNSSGGRTTISNTTITGNTSGEIGAGVYYTDDSELYIYGKNTIQENYYEISESESKLNNLNIYDKDHPVYVNGSLEGSRIGLSDPELWGDGLADESEEAASAFKLTSGFKEYNPDTKPDAVFTSDHNTWTPDFGEIKDSTTRWDYGKDPVSWEDVKVTDYVYGVEATTPYKTGSQLYYNTVSKEYVTASGNKIYPLSVILKGNTYYLSYKVSSYGSASYYLLKELGGEPEKNTFNLGGREMTYDYHAINLGIDGISYLRTSELNVASVSSKTVSCYELTEVSNEDGYDYSNEVRLVRGYAIKYKDGDAEAEFDISDYPKIYKKGTVVTLVAPKDKEGYTFAGWYRHAEFTGDAVTELSADEEIDADGNIVLYAKWIQKEEPTPTTTPVPTVTPTTTPAPTATPTATPVPTVTPTATPITPTLVPDSSSGNTSGSTSVKTGDESNMVIWVLLLGVAFIVILMTRSKAPRR